VPDPHTHGFPALGRIWCRGAVARDRPGATLANVGDWLEGGLAWCGSSTERRLARIYRRMARKDPARDRTTRRRGCPARLFPARSPPFCRLPLDLAGSLKTKARQVTIHLPHSAHRSLSWRRGVASRPWRDGHLRSTLTTLRRRTLEKAKERRETGQPKRRESKGGARAPRGGAASPSLVIRSRPEARSMYHRASRPRRKVAPNPPRPDSRPRFLRPRAFNLGTTTYVLNHVDFLDTSTLEPVTGRPSCTCRAVPM